MNDLNELFARIDEDPTLLTKADIDAVVAWQRQQRAKKIAGGGKAKKEAGPALKIDLQALGLSNKPAGAIPEGFKRRV